MRILYILLPIFVISVSSSSCIFSDLFGGSNGAFVADTVIVAPNIDHIEVQTVTSDTSYTMVSYWTDEDGRPLYKKSKSYFVNGVKDGREEHWNTEGIRVFDAYWANGNPTTYWEEYYNSGKLKRRIEYDNINGYARFEYNFHEDGSLMSDTIMYVKGRKEGEVSYYDPETGELTETYIYARDSLIAIRIYKKEYERLAQQALALQRSMASDSASRQKRDSIFNKLLGNLNALSGSSGWSNENNDIENLQYLEELIKKGK